MYKYVLNYVVKISMMFAKYYTIILRGPFFVNMLYISLFTASAAEEISRLERKRQTP